MPPPPTPCLPPTPSIRGSSWRQPSPIQTPECTTRTLAFDSAASSIANEASLQSKKRRRRVDQSAAFITDRRPLDTEENEELDESKQMWTAKSAGNASRLSSSVRGQVEDNQQRTESPFNCQKATPNAQQIFKADNRQMTVDKLRLLVKTYSAQHHVVSALFYADKLVTMSPNNENDVLLFADACFLNQEFHRAIHSLKKARLANVEGSKIDFVAPSHVMLRACLLLGKCMLAIKQKEECLELLGSVLPDSEQDVVQLAKKMQLEHENAEGMNVVSSLALLLGETFEAVGNRENATVYYRIALRCDVHCSEAFFHLFDKQMLTMKEEKELMASLDFSGDEMHLLQLLYQTHVGKYDTITPIEERFAEVEHRYGLTDNLDLSITRAEAHYYQHDIQQAHKICESVRERDPFNFRVIAVYVGTIVELGKKRELYYYAHQLVSSYIVGITQLRFHWLSFGYFKVEVYPTKAAAWYTVGCYYLLTQKYEAAQRYFQYVNLIRDYHGRCVLMTCVLCSKATSLEPSYAPAWIGFGNTFAAQDESDQAMSSYRTALSLFPGSHLPPLYIGMEHLRTNNLSQAQDYFQQANKICPTDPLVYNEMGSVYYKQKKYFQAINLFTEALQQCKGLPERLMVAWEPTLFNLGYSYRKLRFVSWLTIRFSANRKFDQAIYYFQCALRLSPRNVVRKAINHLHAWIRLMLQASTLAALGFTNHMKGNLEQAIECYHAALAYAPEDTLAGSMITVAFEESMSRGIESYPEFADSPPKNIPKTSGLTPLRVRRSTGNDRNSRLSRGLDQSYSSLERSRQSLACSSLDFSDDGSMMNVDDDE
ncbi:hypothetical protein CCR75_007478 [Bremia lactucae]|uniref:Anaphase-promoting complex subunit 6 n=1 Tax=Bremia lactucae TaxID=4779 RepID=A0A976IEC7_BRELC|nr:hypothetical protein CCR75_007478 [Bremia lactucae]